MRLVCAVLGLLYALRGVDAGHDWLEDGFRVVGDREWQQFACTRCGAVDRVWRSL